MGGIGKTELAIQYAQFHLSDYMGGICWLSARSVDIGVGEQIIRFARIKLDLKMPNDLDKDKKKSDRDKLLEKVAYCWEHWSEFPILTLIIIDDVVDYKQIKPYLPPTKYGFKVLLTSKFDIDSSIQQLYLKVLTLDEALKLLQIFIDEDRIAQEFDTANLICESLGCLPLALELVGRYLSEDTQLSLDDMLNRLKSYGLDDESINVDDTQELYPTMNAQRGVKAAFELTWESLDEPAINIGRFLGFFEFPDWKLIELIAQALGYTNQQIRNVKKQLQKRYVVEFLDNGEFDIHPLIRQFISYKSIELQREENQFSVDNILGFLIKSEPYQAFDLIRKSKVLSDESRILITQYQNNVDLPSPIEIGNKVQMAIKSWIKGLTNNSQFDIPLNMPFIRDGNFPKIGTQLTIKPLQTESSVISNERCVWVQIAFGHKNSISDEIIELPLQFSIQNYRECGWFRINEFVMYKQPFWHWHWTFQQIVDSIKQVFKERAFQVDSGYLSLEAAWHIATRLTKRNPLDARPIPLNELEDCLSNIRKSQFDLVRQHCLHQLFVEIEYCRNQGRNFLSLPSSATNFRNGQI